jgi:hypothetical protein
MTEDLQGRKTVSAFYVGWREPDGTAHVRFVDGERVRHIPLRTDLANHSPTGFEWGYQGSGPAQLAVAMLAHATGQGNLAVLLHQPFKREFVGLASRDFGWVLRRDQVLAWVEEQRIEPTASEREPGDETEGTT